DTAHLISADAVAGKFAVLDVPAGFDRRSLGPWLGRYRVAAALGIVLLDQLGSESIARLREGRPVTDTTRNATAIPLVWLSRRGARTLLGGDPETLSPGFAPARTVSGQYDFPRKRV